MGGGADEASGGGEFVGIEDVCDAEVGEFHDAVVCDHDIFGFDIAVDDTGLVSGMDGIGH